ncbi:MAG TPA: right-handed parallel beta-helix repeat-containing protein [Solirubrobacteraceae bacterium]|nr:right-handed parallel beta-helix repeat-containing protein [Solirubrobacteraceae bacterium]
MAALSAPALAVAHIERDSYWPDPAPDAAVSPPAGGEVPKPRSLASALKLGRGDLRVVCQRDSLRRARQSLRQSRRAGIRFRPTAAPVRLTRRQARRAARVNARLYRRCGYRQIQHAIEASGNNDRIVVMPGVYTEPYARAHPTNDRRCEQYLSDSEKGTGAMSYTAQFHCPHDQNLLAVLGRALGPQPDPPTRADRHGIPNAGPCIRCNLQLEGSTGNPDDVVIEAGDAGAGNGGPSAVGAAKDVALRGDRADGLVVRNMTFRHAAEHNVYVIETDGYLLDNVKFFYGGEYGSLTFVSDHGLTSDCEAMGHGDSGVYPGAAPDTGEQTVEAARRANQTITRCDVHHNTLGYSGTMGNGTRVVGNDFFDNGTGIATDSFFAGGHPGYPQDGAVFEDNEIYSNNFNTYAAGSDVTPRVPIVNGTGILIAGGNANEVRGNRIWDNWRRGVMLIEVPDAASDHAGAKSTSHRNRFHDNLVGVAPDGARKPNGVDFWWDESSGQEDNCWYDNRAFDGTDASVTYDPPRPLTPANCDNVSTGATYATRARELGGCAAAQLVIGEYDPSLCPWFTSPEPPGGDAGARDAGVTLTVLAQVRESPDACRLIGTTQSCTAFRGRP